MDPYKVLATVAAIAGIVGFVLRFFFGVTHIRDLVKAARPFSGMPTRHILALASVGALATAIVLGLSLVVAPSVYDHLESRRLAATGIYWPRWEMIEGFFIAGAGTGLCSAVAVLVVNIMRILIVGASGGSLGELGQVIRGEDVDVFELLTEGFGKLVFSFVIGVVGGMLGFGFYALLGWSALLAVFGAFVGAIAGILGGIAILSGTGGRAAAVVFLSVLTVWTSLVIAIVAFGTNMRDSPLGSRIEVLTLVGTGIPVGAMGPLLVRRQLVGNQSGGARKTRVKVNQREDAR